MPRRQSLAASSPLVKSDLVASPQLGWAMFTFLNDAMFFTMRCFPILNDAKLKHRAHDAYLISMFFKQLKSSGKFTHIFLNVKQRANFQNSNSVFGVCKSYSGLHFWLNNQAFVIALNKVPKTKNIM